MLLTTARAAANGMDVAAVVGEPVTKSQIEALAKESSQDNHEKEKNGSRAKLLTHHGWWNKGIAAFLVSFIAKEECNSKSNQQPTQNEKWQQWWQLNRKMG